jgi:Dna[CI] antecedent, DciA
MEHVAEALFGLYRGMPQHNEWVIACLEGAWPRLIGERLAEMCRPIAFKNRELVIKITDESWGNAIRDVKQDILDRLRSATSGEIQSLSLTPGP